MWVAGRWVPNVRKWVEADIGLATEQLGPSQTPV